MSDNIANKRGRSKNVPPDAIPKDLMQQMLVDIRNEASANTKTLEKAVNEIREAHRREHFQHDEFHKQDHVEVNRRFTNLNNSEQKISELVNTFAPSKDVDSKLDGFMKRLEVAAADVALLKEVTARTLGEQVTATAKAMNEQLIASAKALSEQVISTAKEMDGRVGKIEVAQTSLEKTLIERYVSKSDIAALSAQVGVLQTTITANSASKQGTGDTIRWIQTALGIALAILAIYAIFN